MDLALTTQIAAILGGLGAALALLARGRAALVAGFALLAAAEAGLGVELAGGWDALGGVSPAAAVLAGTGVLALVGGAALLVRYPAAALPLLVAAAPFRLPIDFDRRNDFFVAVAESGQLGRLLPLYAVLATAVLALAWTAVLGNGVRVLPRAISWPAAAFFVLASASLLWSDDPAAGADLLAYFLLPFAGLVAVAGRAAFAPWLPRALAAIAVALASLFAVVGIWQAATERLLFFAPNLEVANAYAPFFRVTSLFRDPSLYGRHLVLGVAVLLVLMWLRRLPVAAAAALVALVFAGLYFSYSQSSMVALFAVTLAVTAVAGDRLVRPLVVVAASVTLLVAAGVVAASVEGESTRRATSDRSRRVELAAQVFADRPVTGVGIGAQPHASQLRSDRPGPRPNFVSHATPLTVAAELGVLGLALYVALLGGAARAIDAVRRRDRALGLALGGVLLALVVHSLFYSGFFEDPVTWLVLGVAGGFLAARGAVTGSGAILRDG